MIYASFPVNPAPYDPDTTDLVIILTVIAAYFFGFSLIIYIPVRFIHWLITRKPIARWEKVFLGIGLALIFIAVTLLEYHVL